MTYSEYRQVIGSCLRRKGLVKALTFNDFFRVSPGKGSCLRRNDGVKALAFNDLLRVSLVTLNKLRRLYTQSPALIFQRV